MPSARLGNDKNQFCKSLVWLDNGFYPAVNIQQPGHGMSVTYVMKFRNIVPIADLQPTLFAIPGLAC